MEIELPCRDIEPILPDFIKIIKDVTGIKGYSNHAMSKSFPKDLLVIPFACNDGE